MRQTSVAPALINDGEALHGRAVSLLMQERLFHAGVERRVTLSSIRAPKLGRRDEKPEAWAVEAKEFLRQLLIGECSSISACQLAKDVMHQVALTGIAGCN